MSPNNHRSHAAHAGKTNVGSAEHHSALAPPSELLHSESAHVNTLLEHLDDVVFSAVMGDAAALKEARVLWPEVVQAIGWALVDESREQYLRYAIAISRSDDTEESRKPESAIAALEVISLLTRD